MKEIAKNEILNAMAQYARNTDEILFGMNKRFDKLEADVTSLKYDVTSIQSQMVTKSYLDDKLSDLRGDLVQMVDRKIQLAISR
ncbi:hypothetical protein HQ524_04880 [Candidatus Uhrbacteria bacterium]|nr:hypothetical protein [Candidatus Uhrbacteria bacterium]